MAREEHQQNMRNWTLNIARKGWFPAAIVLLYLYSFPYFTAIKSANELPRIYLTMAMVDRGTFDIEQELRRFQPTTDTSIFKGKRYSNKAPGSSFLTVPIYIALKLCNGWEPVSDLKELFFWFRIFGSVFPSLLFLLLLWRMLRHLLPDPGQRRIILAAYALGTMALTYGTLFISHQLSSILLATSFILIFLRARGEGSRWWPLWAGIAAGAGVFVDYQVAFIGPPLFLYMIWSARRIADVPSPETPRESTLWTVFAFCAGSSLFLGTLLYYHWACFEDPFKTGYDHLTNPIFKQWVSQGFMGLSTFSYQSFIAHHFSADDGLFYYSPFLLLALPGFAIMLLRPALRAEAIFCGVIVCFFIYFSSALVLKSGWDVGPRYVTCALPYYVILAAPFIKWAGRRWYGNILTFGLIGAAILINTSLNAVFPHYPDNFSNPLFDVTLRFSRAGYLPYNLGWVLGLKGLASAIPYIAVVLTLIILLIAGGKVRPWRRLAVTSGAVAIMAALLLFYHSQLSNRALPVPASFLPWMERIWEPRHSGMDLQKLLPVGDLRTGDLATKR